MKLVIVAILTFFIYEFFAKQPDQLLHLVVCDVGQGDTMLLSLGTRQILIDTGPDESLLSCLDDNMPFMDKKIDVLVLTHFDDDHIGGFSSLSQSYQVRYIFLPLSDYKDSDAFLELKERIIAMQALGTIVKEPFLGQQIALYDFSPTYQAKYNSSNSLNISFLTPTSLYSTEFSKLEEKGLFLWQKPEQLLSAQGFEEIAYKESDNDGSIVLLAEFGELKILLLGDLESTRELALLSDSLITRVDIQKVGHHGSKSSSTVKFLEKSRPEIALISCGLNNKFGHPNQEVLDNFAAIGSRVMRTDASGTIKILSDGQQFWLKD